MKRKILKKVYYLILLIFSVISLVSLGFSIDLPKTASPGYVNEWSNSNQ